MNKNKFAPYQFVWDLGGGETDGSNISSIEEGLSKIEVAYTEWILDEIQNRTPKGSKLSDFISDWNAMIDYCSCWIAPLIGETIDGYPEYEEDIDKCIFLPKDRCKNIGWLYWNEMPKTTQDAFIKELELIDDITASTTISIIKPIDDDIIAE